MEKNEKLFLVLGSLLVLTEAGKQLLLTYVVNNGSYDWWYFPFQLCSLPIYLLPIFAICNSEKVKETLLTFLMTYSLLGAMAAFLDTSGMQYSLRLLTLHSYGWHILLILIGCASGVILYQNRDQSKKNAPFSLRTFFHCTLLYLLFCAIASILNRIITPFHDINMFYINPKLPMEQVFFTRLSLLLGNSTGIIIYIAATILGSFFLFLIWRIVCKEKAGKNSLLSF